MDSQGIVTIPLSRGMTGTISAVDSDRVSKHSWSILESNGRFYAKAKIGGKNIKLHRFLLDAPSGVLVDHRDGNGLNNTRPNIRLATHAQNAMNQKPINGRPLKGIDLLPYGAWRARIHQGVKQITIGIFPTAEEAARAYDEAAVRLFGEFARLNFPLAHAS